EDGIRDFHVTGVQTCALPILGARQGDTLLTLIFAAAIAIRSFTNFVAFKKQHLRTSFTGINFCGQGGGVGKLERYVPFPLGLKRGDVDDDAATRVSAFT